MHLTSNEQKIIHKRKYLSNTHCSMAINYHNKIFRSISNTENGQVSTATTFEYKQEDELVTAIYAGGSIRKGQLVGLVNADGAIEMRYHHVDTNGVLMTGKCHSVPEILPTGKIRLHETWQWTSGDFSQGKSIIEEI